MYPRLFFSTIIFSWVVQVLQGKFLFYLSTYTITMVLTILCTKLFLSKIAIHKFLFITLIACQDRAPLGLRNGLIRDEQITASSTFDNEYNLQPHFARLDSPYRWCSGTNKEAEKEYLQVCLFITMLLSSGGWFSRG